MAWDQRPNDRRYLYRSERLPGGQVRRHYIGCGGLAELLASAMAETQERRAALRAQRQESLSRLEDLGRLSAVSHAVTIDQVKQALTKRGFHERRGQWRKRTISSSDGS